MPSRYSLRTIAGIKSMFCLRSVTTRSSLSSRAEISSSVACARSGVEGAAPAAGRGLGGKSFIRHRQEPRVRDIERHEPSQPGSARRCVEYCAEHTVCVLEVKGHELLAGGKERQRVHAVHRREIRKPAIGPDEAAGAPPPRPPHPPAVAGITAARRQAGRGPKRRGREW